MMRREVKEILVIRIFQNVALAISTQNINITACDLGGQLIRLTPENIQTNLNLLHRDFSNQSFLDGFRNVFTLARLINEIKPDIVHVNALQDLVPVFLAVHLRAGNGHRPAIIGMSHSPLSWENPKSVWLNSKFIKYFADGFVSLATTHSNQLLRLGVLADKIMVIPNPYDPAQIEIGAPSMEPNVSKSKGVYKVIYVANLCERKAQDILINAAAQVIRKHPEVKFELIGKVIAGEEAYVEKLKSLVKDLGVEDSVQIIGEVPYKKVLSSLYECNLFVFPTLAEMMPRAVIEAMVIGKPVIASAVDGILDLIQDRKTGILVQPGNISEFANAVTELIENPELANELGMAGRKYVLEYCSPEKVGRQFRDFYEFILNKKYSH